MYCQTCGEPLPDDSLYCPSCGRRTGDAALQADEEPLEYAGFIRRFVAYVLDTLVLVALTTLLVIGGLAFIEMYIGIPQTLPSVPEIRPVSFAFVLILSYVYYTSLESSPRQATVGKRALGIAVTDTDGERITFKRATVRFIGKFLSRLFVPVFIIIAVTRKKQGLHDMAASTLVVKKRV